MHFVQISDMHVTRDGASTPYGADPGLNLAHCVDHLRRMSPVPDAIIASGDLVNEGDVAEYERLRLLLENAPFMASAEPPACQVHYWNGDELVTHTVSIP